MAATTLRFRRTDSAASPAVLVAAWLIDALGSADGVTLTCSGNDLFILDVIPSDAGTPISDRVNRALTESRFAGWDVHGE